MEAPADRDHLNDIVLATGGEPIIPIRGLRGLEGLWTSREATGMKAVPHRRLALGGGVSA